MQLKNVLLLLLIAAPLAAKDRPKTETDMARFIRENQCMNKGAAAYSMRKTHKETAQNAIDLANQLRECRWAALQDRNLELVNVFDVAIDAATDEAIEKLSSGR
jgi:hypothetical protein